MSDEPTMTMEADGWHSSKHRRVTVRKIENGFIVEATFPISRKDKYSSSQESREFVFQNLSETIAWVNKYLSADVSELQQ